MARRRRRTAQPTWRLWAGAGFLLLQLGGIPSPAWARRQPLDWWFNPTSFEIVYQPGLTPPAPGFRPASAWEIEVYGSPVLIA